MKLIKKIFFVLFLSGLVSCSGSNDIENFDIAIATTSNEVLDASITNNIDDENKNLKNKVKNYTFGVEEDRCPILRVAVQGDPIREKYISLTFDSAYENTRTIQILDILDEYDAKATFFMTGEFVSHNLDQVKEIIDRGHDIGNHSYMHPNFKTINDKEREEQINIVHKMIKDEFDIDMKLFRFPFGDYNARSVEILKELDYYPIQWTYDSIDWRNEGVEAILKKFQNGRNLEPGYIILFHNGAKFTPEALPTILEDIKQKGLKCVKLTDLIYENDFYIDGFGTQIKK